MRNRDTLRNAWAHLRTECPSYNLPSDVPSNNYIDLQFKVNDNPYGVRSPATIRLSWDDNFPYGQVDAYARDKDLAGFPHQMAADRKLCLRRQFNNIADEARLARAVKDVEEWLSAMTKNELVKPGDVYELPDFFFDRNQLDDIPYKKLVYVENNERYKILRDSIGTTGFCKLKACNRANIILPREFRKSQPAGELIDDIPLEPSLLDEDVGEGLWILLSDICYERHRPPRTWEELFKLAERNDIQNVRSQVRRVWEKSRGDYAYVIVGWPIPDRIGNEPTQLAWRACAFPSFDFLRRSSKGEDGFRHHPKDNTAGRLWLLSEPGCEDYALRWLDGENIAHEFLSARWKICDQLRRKRIAFLGCGAIGSVLVELLARGGAEKLTLIDGEMLEFGNLCRHVLDLGSVNQNKAKSLAVRMRKINPLASVNAFGINVIGTENLNWGNYDLVIDCSANEQICYPLSNILREQDVQYVKMFIDARAESLVVASSGSMTRCDTVLDYFFSRHFDSEVLFNRDVSIMAPGCWHPTYPGKWSNIIMLMGAAVPALELLTKDKMKSDGHLMVYEISNDENGIPKLELKVTEDVS